MFYNAIINCIASRKKPLTITNKDILQYQLNNINNYNFYENIQKIILISLISFCWISFLNDYSLYLIMIIFTCKLFNEFYECINNECNKITINECLSHLNNVPIIKPFDHDECEFNINQLFKIKYDDCDDTYIFEIKGVVLDFLFSNLDKAKHFRNFLNNKFKNKSNEKIYKEILKLYNLNKIETLYEEYILEINLL
jgi:hypothetical protein